MNTINPKRLKNVVHLLSQRKGKMDSYIEEYVFKPYGVDIRSCLINKNLTETKKLMDFSFNTRQGGKENQQLKIMKKKK